MHPAMKLNISLFTALTKLVDVLMFIKLQKQINPELLITKICNLVLPTKFNTKEHTSRTLPTPNLFLKRIINSHLINSNINNKIKKAIKRKIPKPNNQKFLKLKLISIN